jgi:hypothetical protein
VLCPLGVVLMHVFLCVEGKFSEVRGVLRFWKLQSASTTDDKEVCCGRCVKREPCPKRSKRVWNLVTRGALQIG